MKISALLLVGSLSGCGGYRFAASASTYAPGAAVKVTLRNLSVRELLYNWCDLELDRRDEDRWQGVEYRIHITDENGQTRELRSGEYACEAVLHSLGPGGWSTERVWLDPTAPAGDYRFRTRIEMGRKSLWWFTYGRSRGFDGYAETRSFRVTRR